VDADKSCSQDVDADASCTQDVDAGNACEVNSTPVESSEHSAVVECVESNAVPDDSQSEEIIESVNHESQEEQGTSETDEVIDANGDVEQHDVLSVVDENEPELTEQECDEASAENKCPTSNDDNAAETPSETSQPQDVFTYDERPFPERTSSISSSPAKRSDFSCQDRKSDKFSSPTNSSHSNLSSMSLAAKSEPRLVALSDDLDIKFSRISPIEIKGQPDDASSLKRRSMINLDSKRLQVIRGYISKTF